MSTRNVNARSAGVGGVVAGCVAALCLAFAPAAFAEAPWWHVQGNFLPSALMPGHSGQLVMTASDLGDAAIDSENSQVTLSDILPAGVTATGISSTLAGEGGIRGAIKCPTSFPTSTEVRCVWSGPAPLQPYEGLEVTIDIEVASALPGGAEENVVRVAGGQGYSCQEVPYAQIVGQFAAPYCGAPSEAQASGQYRAALGGEVPPAVAGKTIPVSSSPPAFGVDEFQLFPEGEGGSLDLQAGSHPVQLTSIFALNQGSRAATPPALTKDVRFDWPPGLVGNAVPLHTCSDTQFGTIVGQTATLCPTDTAVGVASVNIALFGSPAFTHNVPVFALEPRRGEPARFGFEAERVPVTIDTAVRTGGDYGVTVSTNNLSTLVGLVYARVTIWGVPGDPVHDKSRGWSCLDGGFVGEELPACGPLHEARPFPFLTLPTSCDAPLQATMRGDSWPAAGSGAQQFFGPVAASVGRLEGCGKLPFIPSITSTPDVAQASSPTGLAFGMDVPQEAGRNAEGLVGSYVKDATVTLPEGVVLNPSGAGGLAACSEAQVGFQGFGGADGSALFTANLPEPFCADAAKVGTVKVKLPILANPLEGSVYVATQNENPFGSLVAMYIVAQDPVSGVLAKLAGEVSLNPVTGQIVSTFKNIPQAPIEHLELHLFGGNRGALTTPAACGTYTTTASLTPWSGAATATPSSAFAIASGPGGGACPNPRPFAPSFTAGTTSPQAGAFSAFTTTFSREDADQALSGVSVTTPPGLLGILKGVERCGEPQAALGTCGQGSLIGHATAAAGSGPEPFYVQGGQVFLTGPYGGAPFGLSIVVPAVAGPFNLGNVVVRAAVGVDPHTARITVVSDPLPTILQGIPLDVRKVNVTIDRQGFMFNPTSCEPLTVNGALTSTQGASAQASSPFRAVNCASLAFHPAFTVSTQAATSRRNGASLDVKVGYPSGAQANIHAVSVTLPKQLPARLTTLQQACPEAVFAANPAGCPAASVVGFARASTPVLAGPISGPAFLVSHGGAAFPDLVVVLQGEGVAIDLLGNTNIRKGVTSSTFAAIPDAPISSFELKLPEGPHSALGATLPAKAGGSLCGLALTMPTTITAQNGAVVKQTTKIKVTGCPAARRKPKKARHARAAHGGRRSTSGSPRRSRS